MIIGVTGSSGSGKTAISNLLKEKLECSNINADYIAKRLSKKGQKYYDEIVLCFGQDILNSKQEIDRKKLANIIYDDCIKREKLNDITNIYVVDEIKRRAVELEKEGIVIIDVPRLIESGLNKICDIVLSVLAEYDIRLERIRKRDNINIEIAERRLKIQPNDNFYISNSDYVIRNNYENVETQIEEISYKIIKEIKKK